MTEQSPSLDTVRNAAGTPDHAQPWSELGLKSDEYANIREILGRRPTSSELAMYSVMWSEHCSYKSSKVHLKQFGDNVTDQMREHLMVGMGENAGVVDIGDGYAVTFKVESHNHPSYVEPAHQVPAAVPLHLVDPAGVALTDQCVAAGQEGDPPRCGQVPGQLLGDPGPRLRRRGQPPDGRQDQPAGGTRHAGLEQGASVHGFSP